jgi:hypothetical protein
MDRINLERLINFHKLDKKKLAKELFPGVKHPRMALSRILSGSSELTESEISRLSALCGVSIGNLFEAAKWRGVVEEKQITLKFGSYTAFYNRSTNSTKLFDNDTLFHETIIHKRHVLLSEYIEILDELIKIHQKN